MDSAPVNLTWTAKPLLNKRFFPNQLRFFVKCTLSSSLRKLWRHNFIFKVLRKGFIWTLCTVHVLHPFKYLTSLCHQQWRLWRFLNYSLLSFHHLRLNYDLSYFFMQITDHSCNKLNLVLLVYALYYVNKQENAFATTLKFKTPKRYIEFWTEQVLVFEF